MHELSIALKILEAAAEEARRRGGVRVHAVHLKLGPLSGVEKDALISAYELASEHSEVPGSSLVIEDVPLRVYCPTCRAERQPPSIQLIRCPVCGTRTPELLSGRELDIVGMEVSP